MEKKVPAVNECLDAFCRQMNEKAGSIGMRNSYFNDPAGGENTSTARDMLRCLLMASGYEALYDIWNKDTHTVNIQGPQAREFPVRSSVTAADDSHFLTDHYPIMGGKTGSHMRKSIYNLVTLVDVPGTGDWLACAVLYAQQPNGEPNNRFVAAKQAVDAALEKQRDCAVEVCAECAAVCKVPKHNSRAYSLLNIPVLFEKNADEVKEPKSASKILTAMLTLDYVADLHTKITVEQEVIDAMPGRLYDGEFKAGDIITVKDALFAMLLPSSNTAAFVLAHFVGQRILQNNG